MGAANVRYMGIGNDQKQLEEALRSLVQSGVPAGRNSRVPIAEDVSGLLLLTITQWLDTEFPRRDRRLDKQIAWSLLRLAITGIGDAPEGDRPLLVAASHLIAAGRNPRALDQPAPYGDLDALARSIGVPLQGLLRAAGIKSGASYESTLSLRQMYAAYASGLGRTRDTVRPQKTETGRAISPAIASALQRTLEDAAVVRRLVAEASAEKPSSSSSVRDEVETGAKALPASPTTTRRMKPLVWVGAAAAAAAIVVVGILVANAIRGTAQGIAEASAPLATIESIASEPPKWTINTAFWVPVGAPLEELEGITDGCADPRARDWLLKYGQYRDHYLFKVRNISDETVGISNVVSRGTATAPQPGLIVKCSGGGEGGEIEWSVLRLEFGEGAVATLADTARVSDYFWLNIPPGETSGVLVYPSGEQDFKGTLTVDVAPTSGQVAQLTIPALEETDGARPMEWHAMPSDKRVTLSLPSPGELATCEVNGSALERCTAIALREAVDTLWQKE